MLHVLYKSRKPISKVIELIKQISLFFFFTHELEKSGDIDVQQIRSCDNLADLFTEALPTSTFKKLVYDIGM